MYKPFRNLLLAGLGAAVLTKNKILEVTRQLVEQGKLSTGEAEQIAEESSRQVKNWGEMLDQGIRKAVEALNLATREELKELQDRVAALERELALARPGQTAEPPQPPPA